jgi:hypothetical protein
MKVCCRKINGAAFITGTTSGVDFGLSNHRDIVTPVHFMSACLAGRQRKYILQGKGYNLLAFNFSACLKDVLGGEGVSGNISQFFLTFDSSWWLVTAVNPCRFTGQRKGCRFPPDSRPWYLQSISVLYLPVLEIKPRFPDHSAYSLETILVWPHRQGSAWSFTHCISVLQTCVWKCVPKSSLE